MVERSPGRVRGETCRRLSLARDIAASDPGPLDDPFVGRVDGLRELLVGHLALREGASGAKDSRTPHLEFPLAKACARKLSRSSPILRVISFLTMLAATWIALATPLGL